jgi:hypothetical protein
LRGEDGIIDQENGEMASLTIRTRRRNVMKKMFFCVLVLLAFVFAFGQPAIAAPNPPVVVDQLILLNPGDVFGECAFGV